MKKSILAFLVLALFGLSTTAQALTPDVTLDAPAGTQYVTFPATIPVTLGLSVVNETNGNCQTDSVNRIVVTAQHTDDTLPITIHTKDDPDFPKSCPTPYTFNWTVTKPGAYTFVVSARHGSDWGEDTETVVFFELSVEHPAPPAVANAYMNSFPELKKQFSGKVRGCIISYIAEEHAKFESYGNKGGPYDIELIQKDVREMSSECEGPNLPAN